MRLLQANCGFGMLSPSKESLEAVLLDILPPKEAVSRVTRCGKSLRWLNRKKFELKQKDFHLQEEEAVVYSKFP